MKAFLMPALLALVCFACVACEFSLDDRELLERATASFRATEYRAAAVDLRNLLRRQPNDAEARLLLSKALSALGDYDGALSEADKAVELGVPADRAALIRGRALLVLERTDEALRAVEGELPAAVAEHAAFLALRGDVRLELGQYEAARASYEEALRASPKHAPAWAGLAYATYELSGFAAAEAALARGRAGGVDDESRLEVALGHLQNRERRYAEAERTFQARLTKAGNEHPRERMQALAGLCEAQLGLGKSEEALTTATSLHALAPTSPLSLYLKARASFVLSQYDQARQLLEQLASVRPDDMQAKLLLGAVNYAQGSLGQADMYLSAVVASDPKNAFARRLLAETRLRDSKPDEALTALTGEDGIDPESLQLAGQIKLRSGERSAGVQFLEQNAAARPQDREAQLELANAYLIDGQLAQALKVLQAVPPSEKGLDRREYLLIFTKARQRDFRSAEALTRELMEQHPRVIELHLMAAALQQAAGRRDEARRTLTTAVTVDSKSTRALLALAHVELADGKPDVAERHARAALEARPKAAGAALILARVDAARNDVPGAVRWLEQAAEWAPNAAQPRALLARYHLGNGDFERAYSLAQTAVRLAPDDPAAIDLLAQTAVRAGHIEDVLGSVAQRASQSRGSAMHQHALARANIVAGRIPDALAAARAAVRLDPQYLPASLLLGSLLVRQEDLREAQELMTRLKAAYPRNSAVMALVGDLALRRKQYSEAVTAYAAAAQDGRDPSIAAREFQARRLAKDPAPLTPFVRWLERYPRDNRVRTILASARMQLGDLVAARRDYEEILVTEPEHGVALNNLAWLYHQAGDKRALAIAERAYNLLPKEAAVADTYGWILLSGGSAERGLSVLREAVGLAPGDIEIRLHLVEGLAKAGRADDARHELSELLERAPGSERRADVMAVRKSLGDAA
jgi:putative PEP-CTERM system TPR-repeat lipoprotein